MDFLCHEWTNEPAALVSYGSRGGGLAATQLKQVLQGLHMRSTATNIELKTRGAILTGDGNIHDPDAAFADYLPQIAALAIELNHVATTMAKTSHRDPRHETRLARRPHDCCHDPYW